MRAQVLCILLLLFCFWSPASSKALCTPLVAACGKSISNLDQDASSKVLACKELKECKKTCRLVKQEAVKVCRDRNCVRECRYQGSAKKRISCRRECRKNKRRCVWEERADKKECKEECIGTFKTEACEKARKAVTGSGFATFGSCAGLLLCLAVA